MEEILRKEFKKWVRSVTSTGSSWRDEFHWDVHCPTALLQLHTSSSYCAFQKSEKLALLMVVSCYYDPQKKFKREVLVFAESTQLLQNLLLFLNSNSSHLPLKHVHQSGLKEEMQVFETDKVTSWRTIERLLEDFLSAPN